MKFQQIVEYASEKMNMVDNSGHYDSDDETGFFFKQLKDLQLLFNEIFEIIFYEHLKITLSHILFFRHPPHINQLILGVFRGSENEFPNLIFYRFAIPNPTPIDSRFLTRPQ